MKRKKKQRESRGADLLRDSEEGEPRQSKQRWPSFWCGSLFQYRLWQYDSFSRLQRDLCGLHLFVIDLLVLTVPLLFLLLLAFPLGLVPVQFVLRLGVQLLWQEGLQGETKVKRTPRWRRSGQRVCVSFFFAWASMFDKLGTQEWRFSCQNTFNVFRVLTELERASVEIFKMCWQS